MNAPPRRAPGALSGSPRRRVALVTGGAGFIGANLAHRLLSEGRRVLILDNLSRAGVEQNLAWLRDVHGDAIEVAVEDVRDRAAVLRVVSRAQCVFHCAAQVAVTTSLAHPREDFEVNAQGTLNVLEAIRAQSSPPPLVMTSTNKVYGGLEDVPLRRENQRYTPEHEAFRAFGISEARPLDFQSPYGCSKGTADQYVRDYARSFGLPTVVFRMSCIYGPHQFGTEDQGWVTHLLVRALEGATVTIFGDGMQVRDILFVDDLVEAFCLAERHVARLAGRAFNIGGGSHNAISLLDLLDCIESMHGERPRVSFEPWRTGDQRYYVSDTRAFEHAAGWRARTDVARGLRALYAWLAEVRRGDVGVAAGAAVPALAQPFQGVR